MLYPITQVIELLTLVAARLELSPGVRSFMDNLLAQMPNLEHAGMDVVNYFRDQFAKVEAMISEGRDPTEEEWNALAAEEQSEMDKLRAQKS